MSTESTVQEATPNAVSAHDPGHGRAEALRAKAESTAIAEVMSRNIMCLAPEAKVDEVTQMFLERGISSAPVVDANWQPLGIVSKTDLLRSLCDHGAVVNPIRPAKNGEGMARSVDGQSTIGEITPSYVLSLHEEAPISVAAALMAYEGVHTLPIVSSSGEVVGVVSTLDIIKWVARSTDLDISA